IANHRFGVDARVPSLMEAAAQAANSRYSPQGRAVVNRHFVRARIVPKPSRRGNRGVLDVIDRFVGNGRAEPRIQTARSPDPVDHAAAKLLDSRAWRRRQLR